MKPLETLIAEALKTLEAIATHPEFEQLTNLELWDDPAILITDATQVLRDIHRIHTTYKGTQALTPKE